LNWVISFLIEFFLENTRNEFHMVFLAPAWQKCAC
jgi:hypothetical protein